MFINSFTIKNRYVWIARIANQRTTCKNNDVMDFIFLSKR
jgi:hypothetical protein